MKLAILGVVAAGIGVALGQAGLIGIGAYWVLLGPVVRLHGLRLKEANAAGKTVMDMPMFLRGAAIWAALGIPSLVVGLGRIGFDAEHADWRWVPLAMAIFALGFGGVGAALYLAGSALEKETGPPRTIPATLWIVSVRETGTFINERPRLEFVFRVEPDEGTGVAPYEVTKKATTPFTAMANLKPGDGFRAKIAGPEKPESMDISWDEPVAGPGEADSAASGGVEARLEALDKLRQEGTVSEEEYQAQRARILDSL